MLLLRIYSSVKLKPDMAVPLHLHLPRRCCPSAPFNTVAAECGYFLKEEDQLDQKVDSIAQTGIVYFNSCLRHLVKTGHLDAARHMFDNMPQRDVISWTTLISGYVGVFDCWQALNLFSKMWGDVTIVVDQFVLSVALKACGLDGNAGCGKLLHGYSVKSGLVNSVFVGSSLLDMYMKIGQVDLACSVFDEMPLRNVVSWTAIITGLVHTGYNKEALCYLTKMVDSDVECDSYTFASALKACGELGCLRYGKEIHAQTLKQGFDETSYVANTLADMYHKCGKIEYGLRLFERKVTKDVISWTTTIKAYLQMGQEEKAVAAFMRMRESGVKPNEYTFAAVISSCANLSRFRLGAQLHAHVLTIGLVESSSVGNSIVKLYSKCGKAASASLMFDAIDKKDIVSWSTFMVACYQSGQGEEAFKLLSLMRREGPKPNEFALATVLSVCASMALLEQGKQLHGHVISIGLDCTARIRSSLVNMYAKCGSIEDAEAVFDASVIHDIVSWTAMINGYAEHGLSHEAISLFSKIQSAGLKPDAVAYVGVLTACSHAGLVELGFEYFNSITEVHHMNPSKEHYGCMIDLLCRAGRLRDAENMIKNMPLQRDDVVWSTMLHACRIRGDVDRGIWAAKKLLECDPNCAVTHITLANLYAAGGRWTEMAELRKQMRSKGALKEPGWSWLKIKDGVSAFVSGDRLHPESESIYDILGLLNSTTDNLVQDLEAFLFDEIS
ncbi:unnamed protein product [Rhodiola kirilowii]